MKHYDNPGCKTIEEFEVDLKRFTTIKKQLNREDEDVYRTLNNIRIQYNVFHSDACTAMLLHKCPKDQWPQLKTYLVFLNYMPEDMLVDVPLDSRIVEALRVI